MNCHPLKTINQCTKNVCCYKLLLSIHSCCDWLLWLCKGASMRAPMINHERCSSLCVVLYVFLVYTNQDHGVMVYQPTFIHPTFNGISTKQNDLPVVGAPTVISHQRLPDTMARQGPERLGSVRERSVLAWPYGRNQGRLTLVLRHRWLIRYWWLLSG